MTPIKALVIPTFIYVCPSCQWRFDKDDCNYDEDDPLCPNCSIPLILPEVKTIPYIRIYEREL
jgi:DNA-directed RNA polymerase subunit RPC12/RpoP